MNYKSFHFIGIGGIGMSALAQMLVRLGLRVSGSDAHPGQITRDLERMGVRVSASHEAGLVDGAECVVYSSSIRETNPEIVEARRRGLPVLHRSEVLAMLSAEKWSAAVSGTHGKSTTTSILGWIFKRCGEDPTVIVGAKSRQLGGNFSMGAGSKVVFEADESDASFLRYRPDAIIVTNIDNDHLDHFHDIGGVYAIFREFTGRLKPGGRWYGCAECPQTRRLLRERPEGAVSYGFGDGWDYTARDVETGGRGIRFTLWKGARKLGSVQLRLYGRHNALNATAAIALAVDQGVDFARAAEAAGSYEGAVRRFDVKLDSERLIVVDDYAHHPTEIRATIEAAGQYSARRLVVVFQPHRYSRTSILENDFAASFDPADELVVTDVYAAGEYPIAGVSGENLARVIASHRLGPTRYVPREALEADLASNLRPGDFVMTMGAGDIFEAAEFLSRRYRRIADAIRAECRGAVKENEPLAPHTTIKIGGPAECWFEPEDERSLERALKLAAHSGWPVTVIGGGSNLLLPDEGVSGLVVHLGAPAFRELSIDQDGCVTAGAALPLSALTQFLVTNGRGGCEFLLGVPAQVGGAVMMNAGSAVHWLGEHVVRVDGIGFDGRARSWQGREIPFQYRSSGLSDCIITRAVLKFPEVPAEMTAENMSAYSEYRRNSQDLKYPNAGCMFRNPGGGKPPAGKLIEDAGLKGARAGGAQISIVHANFVINVGDARQKDVLELLDLAERTIRDRYSLELRREIKVVLP